MRTINVISFFAVAWACYGLFPVSVEGQDRFLGQIRTINEEVDKWYKKEKNLAKSLKAILGNTTPAQDQSKRYHWPLQMMKVLQASIDVPESSQIDMTMVARITSGLIHDHSQLQKECLENINKYIHSKFNFFDELSIKQYTFQIDEMRRKILLKEEDKLCTPYRSNKDFNFEDAIENLIQLKKTEKVDDKKFIELVVETNQPIAPLYSAAIICKMITSGIARDSIYEYTVYMSTEFSERIAHWPYPGVVFEEQRRFLDRIRHFNEAVDIWYNKKSSSSKNFDTNSEAHQQSKDNHWPRELMRVLQVAAGLPLTVQVDMKKILLITSGLKHKDMPIQKEFVANFNNFIHSKFKADDKTDEMKRHVFVAQTDELCGHFIEGKKDEFNFDYDLRDLVKMRMSQFLSYEQFVERVVRSNQPIAPLYSAAIICRVIIDGVTEDPKQFELQLPLDSERIIDEWPYPYPKYCQ